MPVRYGTHIYLTKNIEKLEKVQRFALRLCVKQCDLDYPSLLFISDLPTLAARRKYFSLCSMFKIVNQLMHFLKMCSFLELPLSYTPQNTFTVSPFAEQTLISTHLNWNSLPLSVRSSDSISSFKTSLRERLNA